MNVTVGGNPQDLLHVVILDQPSKSMISGCQDLDDLDLMISILMIWISSCPDLGDQVLTLWISRSQGLMVRAQVVHNGEHSEIMSFG